MFPVAPACCQPCPSFPGSQSLSATSLSLGQEACVVPVSSHPLCAFASFPVCHPRLLQCVSWYSTQGLCPRLCSSLAPACLAGLPVYTLSGEASGASCLSGPHLPLQCRQVIPACRSILRLSGFFPLSLLVAPEISQVSRGGKHLTAGAGHCFSHA